MAGEKILACKVNELDPGQAKQINLPDRPPLAIFNIDGNFYATDDTCTHGLASLAEGYIEDGVVECPWHGGTFEIATGKPASFPCVVPLKTYKTDVAGDEVYIILD
jgi:nitrite reductase/ring-hydroxylating ferredoxin subunit